MAGDPLNTPGFSIPTLQSYQQALRQQSMDNAVKASGGQQGAGLMASGLFGLSRAVGLLTPEERKVATANQVQQEATRSITASDPTEARLQTLTYMAQRFNQLGMADLSAQIMPEMNALTQRKLELQKLKGEASKATTDAEVATATEGANIDKPYLANLETTANTNLADARKGEIPSSIAKNYASAALERASAGEKANERVNYIKPGTGQMVSILKSNAQAREALAGQGYVESTVAITPAKVGDLQPTKQTQTTLQASLINAQTSLDQLTATMGKFKPEYLQIGGKLYNESLGLLDKSGLGLSANQQASLAGYTAFHQDAIRGLNQYIHDLTGAQMSAAEADRLRQAIADPQRQGPKAFVSSVHETVKNIIAVQRRAQQWLQMTGGTSAEAPSGDEWNSIPLPAVSDSEVDAYMKNRLGIGKSDVSGSATGTKPTSDADLLKKWGG